MSTNTRAPNALLRVFAILCLSALSVTVRATVINCSQLNYSASGDTCLNLQASTRDSYHARYRPGTNGVGIVLFHGRGQQPNGDVMRHLRLSLNQLGYSTLSLEDPVPTNGNISFSRYLSSASVINTQVFTHSRKPPLPVTAAPPRAQA